MKLLHCYSKVSSHLLLLSQKLTYADCQQSCNGTSDIHKSLAKNPSVPFISNKKGVLEQKKDKSGCHWLRNNTIPCSLLLSCGMALSNQIRCCRSPPGTVSPTATAACSSSSCPSSPWLMRMAQKLIKVNCSATSVRSSGSQLPGFPIPSSGRLSMHDQPEPPSIIAE